MNQCNPEAGHIAMKLGQYYMFFLSNYISLFGFSLYFCTRTIIALVGLSWSDVFDKDNNGAARAVLSLAES